MLCMGTISIATKNIHIVTVHPPLIIIKTVFRVRTELGLWLGLVLVLMAL